MSGDVRSLEEVIAAASRQWQRMLDNGEYEGHTVNEVTAAAVREWCLAPQQIERAIRALAGITLRDPPCSTCMAVARAALHAVMGETP